MNKHEIIMLATSLKEFVDKFVNGIHENDMEKARRAVEAIEAEACELHMRFTGEFD